MSAGAVVFIGDPDSVTGFRSLGVGVVAPAGPAAAQAAFRAAVADGASVIMITEAFLDVLAEEIDRVSGRPVPAVLVLPGVTGSAGRGGEIVRKQITRAVGVDLMADDR